MNCRFCSPEDARVFLRNELAYALWDGFPVTLFHALVVSFRQARDYFELTNQELGACDDLLRRANEALTTRDELIKGSTLA
ncbi:MAG TPA: HIT domain-containing protein [Terriglobia bacterium]|nr:HIT domain-containing protein [Terriglobia bacterium]